MFNSYEYHNNIYYNIPVNKRIWLFFLIDALIISFFIPYHLIISCVILLLLIIISKTKISKYIELINKLKFLIIIVFLINLNSISNSFITNSMIILLSCNIKLLTISTRSDEIFNSFDNISKFFHIKNNNFKNIISYTTFFIPLISDSMIKILRSQEARGINFNHSKIRYKLKALNSLLLPLFMTTIKRCQQLVISLELRTFNDKIC